VKQATQVNLEQAERTAASLSEIDGALVFAWDLKLFGAGAKLAAVEVPRLLEVLGSDPPVPRAVRGEELGGTRHQSAARFVGAVPSAFALVVSSDGPVTMFRYVEDEAAVVALRRLDWAL
jgi:hypothetical protein